MHFQAASPKCRWFQQASWGVRELSGLQRRWRHLDCERLWVRDACSEVTWRESSSMRSSSPAVLSVVEGEMLAVVGIRVTSQILFARWEAESILPSVCLASMSYTCDGSRLAQMVRKNLPGVWCWVLDMPASGCPFSHVRGTV